MKRKPEIDPLAGEWRELAPAWSKEARDGRSFVLGKA